MPLRFRRGEMRGNWNMPKNVAIGTVTSDKMAKTRRVEIPRVVPDRMYGKYVRRKTVCFVHDENEESELGDQVEIIETRPKSRKKRWDLVRVVQKSQVIDVAALRAASKAAGEDFSADEDSFAGEGVSSGDESEA